MRQFDCPQCSAPIPFATPGAVFGVCPNCRSMVVRRDIELEAIGTMAELPPDSSPLQIGTSGSINGVRFHLLGRLRLAWQDGTWTEWYADFGNGRNGWVAETQGFFYVSEAIPSPPGLDEFARTAKPGASVDIGGANYQVADIKDVQVTGGEGELPFVAVPGETWRGIDLTGGGRRFAGIEWDGKVARIFLGSSAMPREIEWQGLRAVPGWNGEPVPTGRNLTQALNCLACGGLVERRLIGESSTLSCGHCGTLLDIHGSKAVSAQKVKASERLMHPPIPLGSRGVLRGVEWQALGCLKNDDGWGGWTEVLLHNPWNGFAWLTESNGHWNFVTRLLDAPAGTSSSPKVRDTSYKMFASGEAKVSEVAGEFYWRVRVGEVANTKDFIAPPKILSAEFYPKLEETAWSEGEYLPATEVAQAFGLKKPAEPVGIFLNQPNPWENRWPSIKKFAIFAILLAIALEAVFGISSSERRVLDQTFEFKRPAEAGGAITPIISQPFELTGSQKPATIEVQAGVDNSWIGMDAELVNEKTGQIHPAAVTVEYYHGYDDGGWTEGSRQTSTSLPAVPPGRYHLALTPDADPSISSMPFRVRVAHGGLFWSNFLLCLLALGAWPAWVWFRHHGFEARRWSESDHSP